jgi:DNA-binding NarL/FixJ family response regulator
MRVLIVEDDPLAAIHLAEMVSDFGHQACGTAATVREAVEQADASRPDVALMDLRLARGDNGIEAARLLQQRHGLRCIFVSGHLDDAAVSAMLPLEPIDFVLKPVIPVYLQRALEKAETILATRSAPH